MIVKLIRGSGDDGYQMAYPSWIVYNCCYNMCDYMMDSVTLLYYLVVVFSLFSEPLALFLSSSSLPSLIVLSMITFTLYLIFNCPFISISDLEHEKMTIGFGEVKYFLFTFLFRSPSYILPSFSFSFYTAFYSHEGGTRSL